MKYSVETYEAVLRLMTEKDTSIWTAEPFLCQGTLACATNRYSMAVVPLWGGDYTDRTEKLKGIYPITPNMEKKIRVADLRKAISLAPLVGSYRGRKICEACQGHAVVDFIFEYKGREYQRKHECPVCDGAPVPDLSTLFKQIPDPDFIAEINLSIFKLERIQELLSVAELLQEEEITLLNQTGSNKVSVFIIGDVEMVVAPCEHRKIDKGYFTTIPLF